MAEERYLVFARKWRPQSFEDVIGQEHITRTLRNAIAAGRIGHAFLFIGSRGIGKTTTARILAKALNCLSSDAPTADPCGTCDNCRSIAGGSNIDVIEIDGASNNGVDDIREIRENVRLVPTRARYKIYIIDEVHQLSPGAFNALLKTLEEPPAHAIFILATTEAHKIPATIVSRCQRYDFRRVGVDRICVLLREILDKEGIRCSDEALNAIARAAEGGVRDAESILDQLVSYCSEEIRFQDVFEVLGLVDWRLLHDLCEAILDKDVAKLLRIVDDVTVAGKDLSQFVQDVLRYFRNLLVCKTADAKALLALPDEEIAALDIHAKRFALTHLIRLIEQFAELTKGFDSQLAQRIALETLLIRISKRTVEMSVDALIEKVMQLAESGIAPPSEVRATKRAPEPAPKQAVCAPDRPAPPVPAPIEANDANLAKVWRAVLADIELRSMSVRVGLERAEPVRIEGDAIVLRAPKSQGPFWQIFEQADARAVVEAALRTCVANVRVVRCDSVEDAVQSENVPAVRQTKLPVSDTVSLEDAEAALRDPHVAKVVEVFRGRIVDVKHGAVSKGCKP